MDASDDTSESHVPFNIRTFIGRTDDTASGEGTGPYILDKMIQQSAPSDLPKNVWSLLTYGFVKFNNVLTETEVIYTIPMTINQLFHELVDITNETYCYFKQKSMTE
jgi:hypothetical protein